MATGRQIDRAIKARRKKKNKSIVEHERWKREHEKKNKRV
jgi:hypothetical protein